MYDPLFLRGLARNEALLRVVSQAGCCLGTAPWVRVVMIHKQIVFHSANVAWDSTDYYCRRYSLVLRCTAFIC